MSEKVFHVSCFGMDARSIKCLFACLYFLIALHRRYIVRFGAVCSIHGILVLLRSDSTRLDSAKLNETRGASALDSKSSISFDVFSV